MVLYFGVSPALSVPASPGIHTLTQNDGSTFKATMWGDEWSHGWETINGYSIIFNENTKDWMYAIPGDDGNLVSSAKVVGKDLPPDKVHEHIRPTGKAQLKIINQNISKASGVPDRAVPSTGTAKIPVILINFKDRSTTYTAASFNTLLFGSGTKSMKDYYEEVSYGKFSVSPGPSGVAGWYKASQNHDFYGQNDDGENDMWPGTLVREAVAAADPTFNFAPYDQDGDCYVDVVDLIHQGTDEADGGPTTDIWSHSWNLNSAYRSGYSNGGEYTTNDVCPKGGFIKVNSYVIQPETQSDGQITIGVFAHEYGHALGLPDLYDYTYTSVGVGDWSIMASGNRLGIYREGDTPAHLDAWSKWLLGWVSPIQVRTSSVTQIKRVEDNSVVYQLLDNPNGPTDWTWGTGKGEYFLVENRQKTGFDAALPGAGLLIWHIDESRADNDDYTHKMVDLEEADGQNHLDYNINRGDANDPWYNKVVGFTDATIPNSKLYRGSASGVRVTNIGASGTIMTATLDGLYTGTDVTLPTITITSPTAGQQFTTATATVSGTASDNVGLSKVEVKVGSGSWQTATGTTSWSKSVTLVSGSNTITARATDTSGNIKDASVTVTCTTGGPTVTGISPTTGSTNGGTPITITGTGFTGATAVNFGSKAATGVTVVSATSITATSPSGTAGTVDVTVTTPSGTSTISAADKFTYVAITTPPTITGISPASGSIAGGTSVTISGTSFTGATAVKFGSTAATGVIVVSATSITATSPVHAAGIVDVTVTTPSGTSATSAADKFTYGGNPTFTSISPTFGPDTGGQRVTITGSGFTGTTAVSFNGVAATGLTVASDNQITAYTPAYPAGTSFIAITAAGGSITKQNAYTFAGLPHFVSISPVAGSIAGGNTVTITGTNLTGASAVNFGSAAATGVRVVSANQITAISPAGSTGPISVYVTTFSGSTTTDAAGSNAFTYISGPTFTSISPTNGPISGGTYVTLRGTNLATATQVTFDYAPATNMSTDLNGGLWIKVNAPVHPAGLVNVFIVTPAGTVTNANNKYTYVGIPVISSIAPDVGPISGGTLVSITGLSFTGVNMVTFDGIQATNFTLFSDTSITANAPAHEAGVVSVVVAGTGGTGTGTYTYQTASIVTPTITGISPTSGTTNGGTLVTITGYGFTGTTAVSFNGVAATGLTVVSDTHITVYTPAYPLGGTSFITINAAGGSVTYYNAYTFVESPTTATTTIGMYRGGTYYLRNSNTAGNADLAFTYGSAGDIPVTGDWNGDGIDTIGMYRNGVFYLRNTNTAGNADLAFTYGTAGDIPVTGDWNGDGIDTIGMYRNGVYYLRNTNDAGNADLAFTYGTTGDIPVTGDWNGDGIDTIGMYRNGVYYLRNINDAGNADLTFTYGSTGDIPVTGKWV